MKIVPTFFCKEPWEGMSGNEAARFCKSCGKYVQNIESLTLDQRISILSPGNLFCGRYRVAVRKARPGAQSSYMRHLLKYGTAVVGVSGVLLVLWQLYDEADGGAQRVYRAVVPAEGARQAMPQILYEQSEGVLLGMVAIPDEPLTPPDLPTSDLPDHIDVQLESRLPPPSHS